MRDEALYVVQLISFVTYPQVSSVAFAAFECESFDDGRELLKADYLVACHSGHASRPIIIILATFTIVVSSAETQCTILNQSVLLRALSILPLAQVHLFAIPIYFLVLLRRARCITNDGDLSKALLFLHAPFEAHAFWWEFAEYLKKLLLVGFARVFFDQVPTARRMLNISLRFLSPCTCA